MSAKVYCNILIGRPGAIQLQQDTWYCYGDGAITGMESWFDH